MGLYSDPLVWRFNGLVSGFSRGVYRDIGEGRKTPWRAFYGVLGALYGVVYGMRCPVCLSVWIRYMLMVKVHKLVIPNLYILTLCIMTKTVDIMSWLVHVNWEFLDTLAM